ncbi:MAG TPA: enoyl-CoA hydratase/isomerase family protein [Acidimicrobiales bacterium]|nr:enoyl-CoA hydratase/isomerase family protein [Acidimicrobiales bacterium]
MTAPSRDVSVERDGDIAVVTLRRPPHNLITEPALRAVADALDGLRDAVRAAVVASEGRSFCAGADFRSDEAPDPTDGAAFERRTGAFYAQAERIFASPVPTVAAVQGAAIGAGFGLALACDVRVVGRRGWFQVNFVRLGIHPGFALSVTLPRAVGPGRGAELFLTGRRVDADEAVRIGLAEHLAGEGEELAAASAVARQIAAGAPLAVRSTRATLRAGLVELARAAMRHELAEQVSLAGTADAIEGVAAVLAGREPVFEGR